MRLLALTGLLAAATSAAGATWITPAAFGPAAKPVPLYWFEVKEAPVAYRTVVTVKPGVRSAAALAKSSGYLYVFVDGRAVYAYVPKESEKPDPDRIHGVDLTERLTPGRHAIVVSAPEQGFALDGRIRYGPTDQALATDASWRVARFAPTVILEDEAWMRADCAEQGANVRPGEAFRADPLQLAAVEHSSSARRTAHLYDDTLWRLGLLVHRGIVIHCDEEYGWSGPERANQAVVTLARVLLTDLISRGAELKGLRADSAPVPDDQIGRLGVAVRQAADVCERLSTQQYLLDERLALALASRAVPGSSAPALPSESAILSAATPASLARLADRLASIRKSLEAAYGGAIGVLNRSRKDRLGWIPTPDRAGSQLAVWGIRVGPSTASILATPLSPCTVVTLDGTTMEIQRRLVQDAPGPSEVQLPGGKTVASGQDYRMGRDGRMSANWALLRFEGETARPILFVFEKQPLLIENAGPVVRITFSARHARVIAVRPSDQTTGGVEGRTSDGAESPAQTDAARLTHDAIAFWSRAALAVPVNYVELTKQEQPGPPAGFAFSVANVPPGPVASHTLLYDYVATKDDWGTQPLRIAPLPALASYAMGCGWMASAARPRDQSAAAPTPRACGELDIQESARLISSDSRLTTLDSPYRYLSESDRITYSYRIEPFPRWYGFTSFMFSGADTGVPGNQREVALLQTSGATSYRPQHNFATDKSPYYPDTEPRTRVQIMTDFANAAGMCCIHNIDQTLGGPREPVQRDYPAFMERVNSYWESVARQVKERPFGATAYDLVNEPFDHKHAAYNAAMKALTARIRAIDPVHLLYIEPMEAWGAIEMLKLVEPTGDPLTIYSFHDYSFRLLRPTDRWPTEEKDVSSIYHRWMEAFRFQIQHAVPMHCGEFGGFDQSTDSSPAQKVLMNDFFRIFDQFGMQFNYYSGRSVFGRRADGSMALSNVIRAYREYARR